MGRQRKKPGPQAGPGLPTTLSEYAERRRQVWQMWRTACPDAPPISDAQLDAITGEVLACVPPDSAASVDNAKVRAAIAVLKTWNTGDRVPGLGTALRKAAAHLEPQPSRSWAGSAWRAWSAAARVLATNGHTAGVGADAYAVRFAAAAVQWAGWPTVSADAISNLVREDPDFRNRLIEGVKCTGAIDTLPVKPTEDN